MDELIEFLKENPVQYLATVDLEGKPRVRPFQFMMESKGKLYFCTNSKKNVFQQLKKNPYVELCVSSPKFKWIRLSGDVVFSDNMGIKQQIIDSSNTVKSSYKTADNPCLQAFYLDNASVTISDFSGNPPKKVSL